MRASLIKRSREFRVLTLTQHFHNSTTSHKPSPHSLKICWTPLLDFKSTMFCYGSLESTFGCFISPASPYQFSADSPYVPYHSKHRHIWTADVTAVDIVISGRWCFATPIVFDVKMGRSLLSIYNANVMQHTQEGWWKLYWQLDNI